MPHGFGPDNGWEQMPKLPDHWAVIEEATEAMPYRLVTAPARSYLNSSFTETLTSAKREVKPTVMMHPADAEKIGVVTDDRVTLGNDRGQIPIEVQIFQGVQRGVVVVESIWPNDAFEGGKGINVLTGADPVAPVGGAAFHDNRIWIEKII